MNYKIFTPRKKIEEKTTLHPSLHLPRKKKACKNFSGPKNSYK